MRSLPALKRWLRAPLGASCAIGATLAALRQVPRHRIDHSLSVAATAGATLLALELGFGAVMLAAAAAYAAVALAGSRLGMSA